MRAIDYGESDRIVTFFTDEFGKLKGIAKGARRSKKRFVNAFELFSCSDIVFSRRGRDGLALIEQCDTREFFAGIRGDLESTLFASYFIDLVDRFSAEDKRNRELFRFLRDFLSLVDEGDHPEGIIRVFEIRLLGIVGYGPVLDRCIRCGLAVDDMENPCFSVHDGGILCGKCARSAVNPITASSGTIKTLLMAREMPIQNIRRLAWSGKAVEEGGLILPRFIEHLLGKELNSLRVLTDIRKMSA